MAQAERISVLAYQIGAHHITVMDCWKCGEVYGVLTSTVAVRRRDGGDVYCPNGHPGSFSVGESVDQRIAREAKERAARAEADAAHQRQMREWAESRAKGANIQAGKAKAALRRTIERVHAGVCPHCHRTFKQLAAHMQAKHRKAK